MTTPALIPGYDWWANQGLPALHQGLRAVLPFEWAQFGFTLNALIECFLLAPLCAAMGVPIVNFRLAFFSDAISHSAFTGVAIGFLLNELLSRWGQGFDPRLTLIGFGLLVALGIALVRRKTDLSTDTVVGVFFSMIVALGLAIVTARGTRTADFQRYLYGDILTLDAADLAMTVLLALAVLLSMLFAFTPLTLIGLNAELAQSHGVSVRRYDYLFSVLLALVVTVSIRTAGILLVTGMLLVPAATARNLARSAGGMFRWSVALGLCSGIGGTLLSFSKPFENVSTGAVIVLTAGVLFGLSLMHRRG
jgi:zinc transport system permease protein